MTTIRPNVLPQQVPPGGQREDAARVSAQRAFFQAVMGQAPPTTAPTAPATPVEAPVTVNRLAQAGAEAPQKVLRPGSLLDIRV